MFGSNKTKTARTRAAYLARKITELERHEPRARQLAEPGPARQPNRWAKEVLTQLRDNRAELAAVRRTLNGR